MTAECGDQWNSWNPWKLIPAHYNLGVALTCEHVAQGHGQKTALAWENASGETRSYSYAELDALTNRLAWSLKRLGVAAGDRVFLRLPNRPEFYIAALAIAKLGAVFIPSSTQFHES